jgi:FkbM family methyltransferase
MSKSLLIKCGLQVNAALRNIGLRVTRFPPPADRRRIRLLQSHAIDTVIDIGANAGQYASLLRLLGYRGRIASYEPLPDAFQRLQAAAAADSAWTVVQKAVGDASGTLTLRVARNSVSSSVLEMSERHVEAEPESQAVGSVAVSSISLAEIIESAGAANLMVKIDTQGYERQVLASGAASLRSVRLFEIEMSLVELYSGQALFREIDAKMLEAGFRLASIEEGFFDKNTGELLQMDAIYARVS